MGAIQDFKLKMAGKVDQAKGEVNQQRGHGIKGGLQIAKGKIKERWADAEMDARRDRDIDYDHETV
jgi:uncharacterized protein YjbJ (UPF0337 family)